ncbi:MAG: hypothetical protein JSR49_01860 [Proteobacteria bacterium]|nr:hypothetical protein [Pseudomonadota bacterium]
MQALDLLDHLLNFFAPALFVALCVALAARLAGTGPALVRRWWVQAAINFTVGAAALGAGLWFFGYDGKLASYGALVVGCATSQWLMMRGWRR